MKTTTFNDMHGRGIRKLEWKTIVIEAGHRLAASFDYSTSGDVAYPIGAARQITAGGTSAHWTGATSRMWPHNFRVLTESSVWFPLPCLQYQRSGACLPHKSTGRRPSTPPPPQSVVSDLHRYRMRHLQDRSLHDP